LTAHVSQVASFDRGFFVTSLLVSGIAILLLDQWTKHNVRLFKPSHCISRFSMIHIRRVINLNPIYRNDYARAVLVLVWFLAVAGVVILKDGGSWFQGQVANVGLGLAVGGALGNLLDIVRHHSVLDFIDLRWWPVFNLADVGIVSGLLMAFCS
jgi:signal peptidase II